MLSMVAHNYDPSDSRKSENGMTDHDSGWPGQKVRAYLKNNQSKKV
jgi:hypothetical protein